eukprot:COSAG02_NODE_873_length_16302_cov_113.473616_7_plen_133_part_00
MLDILLGPSETWTAEPMEYFMYQSIDMVSPPTVHPSEPSRLAALYSRHAGRHETSIDGGGSREGPPASEAARKPSAGVAGAQAPSPDPSAPSASPPIPPSTPPCNSSAIASIFVTKSESNHSFQPGYMHLKT